MLQAMAPRVEGKTAADVRARRAAPEQYQSAREEAPGALAWWCSAVVTLLVTGGVVALLVAEYAAFWAIVVAPWLQSVPALHPPLW